MSTEPKQTAVSSMTSIISSIENDRQVYRWFLIFISLPEIRQTLSKQNNTKEKYQNLKEIQTIEIITYLALTLIIIVSWLIKQPWLLSLEAIPLLILLNLFPSNRRCVAAISEQFLLNNFQPDELNQQTLYQTCEYLSKKYNTPSLVDIITFQDLTGRKVLLGAVFFLPFIYPFKTWQTYAATFAVLLTTIAVVNTSIILRKLK